MSINNKLSTLERVLPYYPKIRNGVPQVTYKWTKGSDLLKEDPQMKDANDKPINPKLRYRQAIVLCENHFDRLKEAYQKNGEDGVKEYCALVRAYKSKPQIENKP